MKKSFKVVSLTFLCNGGSRPDSYETVRANLSARKAELLADKLNEAAIEESFDGNKIVNYTVQPQA